MIIEGFLKVLGIVAVLFLAIFIVLPPYMAYGKKNDNYLNDYQNLPITIEARGLRLEKDSKNEPLVYLDIEITNNSKKTINAIDICISYTLYTIYPNGEEGFFKQVTFLDTKPMWKGIKFIGGYSTTTVGMQLEITNNDFFGFNNEDYYLHLIDNISKVECELYITWIRYAWYVKPWGNGYIDYLDAIENAPKIDISTQMIT
ncbi:MAG: DUF5067 domain-containing protein [Chloroflexi bacterium]|nr:DUF5067 domain-containing protein [Chloroflexota bacterium]